MSVPTPEEMASWPAPNYVDPQTRATPLIVTMVLGLALMLPFVGARIYTRSRLKRGFGIDDWIIVAAAAASILSSGLCLYSVKYGMGYHLWDVKPEWIPPYKKLSIPSIIAFNLCVALPKLSMCFTYLRLFVSRANQRFCYTIIATTTCWLFIVTFVSVFQCRPIKSYWDPTVPPRLCINPSILHMLTAVVNSFTDFLVYLWPVPTLWAIRAPTRLRLGIVLMFAIGSLVCIAGVFRIWFIRILFQGYDFLYDGAVIWMTSSIECNAGIAVACMHTIKPILSKIFPSFFGLRTENPRQRFFPASMTLSQAGNSQDFTSHSMPVEAWVGDDPHAINRRSSLAKHLNDVKQASKIVAFNSPAQQQTSFTQLQGSVEAWITGGTESEAELPPHGIRFTQQFSMETSTGSDERRNGHNEYMAEIP